MCSFALEQDLMVCGYLWTYHWETISVDSFSHLGFLNRMIFADVFIKAQPYYFCSFLSLIWMTLKPWPCSWNIFLSLVFSFSEFRSSPETDICSSISLTWKNKTLLYLIFPSCSWFGVFYSLRDVMIGFALHCKCNEKSFLKRWTTPSRMLTNAFLCWMLVVIACSAVRVVGIKSWLSIPSHCFLRLLHYAWQNYFDYCYVTGCLFKQSVLCL